jgi:hypothetical protein
MDKDKRKAKGGRECVCLRFETLCDESRVDVLVFELDILHVGVEALVVFGNTTILQRETEAERQRETK